MSVEETLGGRQEISLARTGWVRAKDSKEVTAKHLTARKKEKYKRKMALTFTSGAKGIVSPRKKRRQGPIGALAKIIPWGK